jgi:hypothetical protein
MVTAAESSRCVFGMQRSLWILAFKADEDKTTSTQHVFRLALLFCCCVLVVRNCWWSNRPFHFYRAVFNSNSMSLFPNTSAVSIDAGITREVSTDGIIRYRSDRGYRGTLAMRIANLYRRVCSPMRTTLLRYLCQCPRYAFVESFVGRPLVFRRFLLRSS